jgi:hypothetical protein
MKARAVSGRSTYRLPVLGFALALGGVGGENRPRTLTLTSDNTPHLVRGVTTGKR